MVLAFWTYKILTDSSRFLKVHSPTIVLLWVESRVARAMGDGFYAASSWSAPSWR